MMRITILWPGKTKNQDFRRLQEHYLEKINRMERCEIIETKEARGLSEKEGERILELEASGIEKYIKDDYIICLLDRGKRMSSEEFARFLEEKGAFAGQSLTFIVGGFLGLAERVLRRAHLMLSLSHMTFSHELTRVVLLEQIYRSLCMIKGKPYAK
ncbi:MAG: 23S rRNA (pseudouridine(1915)-N(3))-methyltransferase RlmH [Candidatus Aminicenantales bacterium]